MPKIKDTLTPTERFCLDAYVVNSNIDMAYELSRKNEPKANEVNLHRLAMRWLRQPPVKAYLAERKAAIYTRLEKPSDMNQDDVKSLVERYKDKDFIIAELIKAAADLDGKEKADVLNRIADLQQMKKEELKKEDERVHFYLPLQVCENCPNKNKLVEKKWG
jgi:hypothetical protein